MVRGLAPTLVNQGSSTIFTEPDQEPVDLPYTDRQHNGRRGNCPSARKNLCQNLHALYVAFAHQHPSQSSASQATISLEGQSDISIGQRCDISIRR